MPYSVRVKPGHPTGTYHRSGQVFTAEPVILDVITEDIKRDPWLLIEPVPAQASTDEDEPDGRRPGEGKRRK